MAGHACSGGEAENTLETVSGDNPGNRSAVRNAGNLNSGGEAGAVEKRGLQQRADKGLVGGLRYGERREGGNEGKTREGREEEEKEEARGRSHGRWRYCGAVGVVISW